MFKTEYVDNFAEFFTDCKEQIIDHYITCEEARKDKQELNIDVKMFQHLIDIGTMNIFKLLDEDDLVGYINVTISPSPLFSKPQATVDFLYILPEHRRKGYAEKAITEIEKELVSEGIYDFNIHLPDKDYSEDVAEKLGYVKTSIIYTKYLGE